MLPPSDIENLLNLRDMLADWLVSMGGQITDRGFDAQIEIADLVTNSPAGVRIEFTLKVLS